MICEACAADGIPLPEYTIHPSDVMVKFATPAERVVLGPGETIKTIPERLENKLLQKKRRFWLLSWRIRVIVIVILPRSFLLDAPQHLPASRH